MESRWKRAKGERVDFSEEGKVEDMVMGERVFLTQKSLEMYYKGFETSVVERIYILISKRFTM